MSDLERFVTDALRTEPNYDGAIKRLQDPRTVRLLHVAMGLATEAGEFVDALKRHIYYGKDIDDTNLIEELGDSTWYERIGVAALEVKYADMLERNFNKLRARFPEKFAESDALNRNLDIERAVLERGAPSAIGPREVSYLRINGWYNDGPGDLGHWKIADLSRESWPYATRMKQASCTVWNREDALTIQREIDWYKGL